MKTDLVYQGILAHRDELVAEMGLSVADEMCEEANTLLPRLDAVRRVLIVARLAPITHEAPVVDELRLVPVSLAGGT